MKLSSGLRTAILWATLASLAAPAAAAAQAASSHDGAGAALTAALSAACRQNAEQFAQYLTAENATAFKNLPEDQKKAVLKRFSMVDGAGRPLLSDDEQGRRQLRCEGPDVTTLFRMGTERVHDSLAFVPVDAAGEQKTEFGLVRQDGSWRLLSLGLLLLDIPQLQTKWAAEDMDAREKAAIRTVAALAEVIHTYRTAFGKLPETLAQLGPAPKDEVSPEAAQLVDTEMATGKKNGYVFRYRIVAGADGPESAFEVAASPAEYGHTGRRSFFLDASGKLHAADKEGAMASSSDPVANEAKPD